MNLSVVYVGFHSPGFRNGEGRIDPRCWLGHVEVWGFTDDDTWLFIDPAGAGMRVRVMHRYDDVMDQLEACFNACDMVLSMPGPDPKFRFPLHGPMTCANVVGKMIGCRALLPSGLRRKLLRNGAQVIHEKQDPKGRSPGEG